LAVTDTHRPWRIQLQLRNALLLFHGMLSGNLPDGERREVRHTRVVTRLISSILRLLVDGVRANNGLRWVLQRQ